MSSLQLSQAVSLQEAEDLICAVGHLNTIHMEGRPGIGKTSMAKKIAERMDLRLVFIDGPTVDIAEIGLMMPNHETATTSLYHNEHWAFHKCDPILLFIDEISKAPRQAQTAMTPMFQERRCGPSHFHERSIVVTTGNYSTDGVGDIVLAHVRNRKTTLAVRGPTSKEWLVNFAQKEVNGKPIIHPIVQAFASKYPAVFASYRDKGEEENPYILNPKYPQRAGTTCRSMHKASNIIWVRDQFSDTALRVALEGTIGKPAAQDLMGYILADDDVPDFNDIIKNPEECPMPKSAAACCILACMALQHVTRANMGKWFTFLKRGSKEMQALFCLSARDHGRAKEICNSSQEYVQWLLDNEYLL